MINYENHTRLQVIRCIELSSRVAAARGGLMHIERWSDGANAYYDEVRQLQR